MGNNCCSTESQTTVEMPDTEQMSPSRRFNMLVGLRDDSEYEPPQEPLAEETRDILPDEINKIHLANTLKISKHEHELTKREGTELTGWACDGKTVFKSCFGGITDFYQTAGVECWQCVQCNFDFCRDCIVGDHLLEKRKAMDMFYT